MDMISKFAVKNDPTGGFGLWYSKIEKRFLESGGGIV